MSVLYVLLSAVAAVSVCKWSSGRPVAGVLGGPEIALPQRERKVGSSIARNELPDAKSRRRVSLTRTAWLADAELSLGEWVDHGRRLGAVGRSVGWWLGDWLRFGNLKFGERYSRASRITGYDAQTLMNMAYVAAAFEPQERRPGLSWSHHAEVAALDDRERAYWLDVAEERRLSVRCLREELRRERQQQRVQALEDVRPVVRLESEDRHVPQRCPRCGYSLEAPDGAHVVQALPAAT